MIKRKMPCYPMFVKDPFFSIWAKSEYLTDENLMFWHGEPKPIYGFITINGKRLCFMGRQNEYPTIKQTGFDVSAFETKYVFETEELKLTVKFLSPLIPDDLEILSCPTCFLSYEVECASEVEYDIEIFIDERICFNTVGNEEKSENIRYGVMKLDGKECGFFGLLRQSPLSHSNDEVGADWGYYYLLGQSSEIVDFKGRKYLSAQNIHKGSANGKFVLGYDDLCSIFYFGQWLKGYYFADGKTIVDAMRFSDKNFDKIESKCNAFDKKLREDCKPFGKEYLNVLYASLRQTMGGHKLVKDEKGRGLWLSKECNSDGCIATVDVSYPSMPLFLKYNPLLLKGMLLPIFDFAKMEIWDNDFAPHDVGIYPYCFGQFYAVINQENKYNGDLFLRSFASPENAAMFYLFPKENAIYDFQKQMPVEECGNMLVMSYAYYKHSGDSAFLKENAPLLFRWAEYLLKKGVIPENQLCTDDFAGHLDKNVNLSIKAACGLKCASLIADAVKIDGERFKKGAEEFTNYIENKFSDKTVMPLTFSDTEETYSLKYNLAIDKLLGLGLFSSKTYKRESDYYLLRMNKYGIPLDCRKEYTKTDWNFWVAYLTNDMEIRKKIIRSINRFLVESSNRVPFSDWIETVSGNYNTFRNRTVQGGLFILLISLYSSGNDDHES